MRFWDPEHSKYYRLVAKWEDTLYRWAYVQGHSAHFWEVHESVTLAKHWNKHDWSLRVQSVTALGALRYKRGKSTTALKSLAQRHMKPDCIHQK